VFAPHHSGGEALAADDVGAVLLKAWVKQRIRIAIRFPVGQAWRTRWAKRTTVFFASNSTAA
jgi:hypothetical protein